MPRIRLFFALSLVVVASINACAPTPAPEAAYNPGFFYLALTPAPTLVLTDGPGSPARKQIPLNPPTDCSLYALRPAPLGRWIAVEWECSFGPAVELFDTASASSHFALSDPTIDSRFLAWQPDGRSLYLKIGTLSVPQTLRVDAASGQALELPVSPFAYDLTGSPDGRHVLYSLTKGIGFGSETLLAGPDGQNPSQILVDATHITALAQYSPDGSQIAYTKFPDNQSVTPPGELWLMDSSGFNARKLADADAGRGFAPVWSPDGARIAFIGRDRLEDPDSLNLSIYDLARAKLVSVGAALSSPPAWSPDGASVAFSAKTAANSAGNTPLSAAGDTINVWLYQVSSGQVNKLISGACCAGWIR
jgi:Tol biopolymer transport system component